MSRKRYLRLKEAEAAGRLRISELTNCPDCGRPNCCRHHDWVYRVWWEKSRPHMEMIKQLRFK